MELLKALCESSGIPGQEGRLRELVTEELDLVADESRIDGLGNLIFRKAATKGKSPKKLMIAAHMDEIGFVVSHIEETGLLRLVPLGGHHPRNMVAQRVTVAGKRTVRSRRLVADAEEARRVWPRVVRVAPDRVELAVGPLRRERARPLFQPCKHGSYRLASCLL